MTAPTTRIVLRSASDTTGRYTTPPGALPRSNLRVSVHDHTLGPLDAEDRARDEIAPARVEEQRLADLREAGVRQDAAVAVEADATVHAVAEREVRPQPLTAAPILHGHADVAPDVVLGVPRHEDL